MERGRRPRRKRPPRVSASLWGLFPRMELVVRLRWVRAAWLLALVACARGAALAEEGEDELSPDAVMEAFVAGDLARLERLGRDAGRDKPDPWDCVDELIAIDEPAAARTFAGLVAVDREPLLRYLATPEALAPFGELRAAFHVAADEFEADRLQSALLQLEAMEPWAGPPHILPSRIAHLRGDVLKRLGRLREAGDAYAEAARHAHSLGWMSQYMTALVDQGAVAMYSGRFEEALECFERLLVLQEERENLAAQAATHADLGLMETMRSDFPRALSRYTEAAHLSAAQGDFAAAADAHSQRMATLAHGGRWAQAVAARHEAEEALRAAKRAIPATGGAKEERVLADLEADHEVRAAVVDWYMGDHASALARTERAETLLTTSDDRASRGVMLGNRGMFFKALGRFDEAERDYAAALELFEHDDDDMGSPLMIANCQLALADLGVWVARQRLRRAHELAPDAREIELRGVRQHVLERALARARLAVRVATKHGYYGEGGFRETLGSLLTALGQYEEAEKELLEARRLQARTGDVQDSVITDTSLVRLRLARGDAKGCIEEARAAMDRATRTDTGTRPDARLRAVVGEPDLYELAVMAAQRLPPEVDAARRAALQFEFLEAGRAMALLDALGGRAAASDAFVPAALRRERDAARAAKTAANVARQSWRTQAQRGEEWRARLRELETAHQQAGDALKQMDARVAAFVADDLRNDVLRPLPVDPGALRLASNEALVTYGLMGDEAWATVATRDTLRSVRLAASHPEVAAIERAADTLLGPPSNARTPALATAHATALVEELRRRLWDPLALPAGVSRVLISPDSRLAYLPWSWIATPEGAVDLALVPSASTFAWLRRDPRGRGSRVLALGAPDYEHVPTATLSEAQLDSLALRGGPVERGAPGRLPRFKPLPHAKTEIERITPHADDVRLLGAQASEDGLWTALASQGERHRWRAVHFAVHGYVDGENPANAFLALTPSAAEDGLLTVTEVMGRQVPADVVVLSACSTGRGDFVRGEGLMGLSRAFLFAGAPRVVASLWPVSDEGTARLMALFYERLDQGLDAARALRQAQAAMRVEDPDPAGWAAWVLWGLPEGPGPAPKPNR